MDLRIKRVIFNPEEHIYAFDGKKLNGITKAIGKLMGKVFPDTILVQASTIYGHDVHAESELWIKERKEPSTESGKWIVSFLKDFQEKNNVLHYAAELIVSDFTGTASCIDIVAYLPGNEVVLFDIKTTSHFDRAYCSLQLSVYKRLYELCYDEKVKDLFVIGTKAKRIFHILDQDSSKIDRVLEMNKTI